MPVQSWVKDLCEGVMGKSSMRVGAIVKHPDGYKVKIIDGQYWGEYGLSNFWTWRRVQKNGKMIGKKFSGYGW